MDFSILRDKIERLSRGVLPGGVLLLLVGMAYVDGPPPAHTGGFGEPTCQVCHFDGGLNEPGGLLLVEGLPDRYEPGAVYDLEVVLARRDLERGGFQLGARFAEGARAGQQAGTFLPVGERVVVDTAGGVEYLRHTRAGTAPVSPDSLRWAVAWQAPDVGAGPVAFHLAANAANGDDSEFGDFIYALEALVSAP